MDYAFNIQELDQIVAPLTDTEKGILAGVGAGIVVVGIGLLIFC